MRATPDNTARQGLREWWASPPRSGLQRIISPWEYRHLRACAGVRIGVAVGLGGLSVVTLAFGGKDRKTYGWAAVFATAAAAHFSFACWLLKIAGSD